MKNNIYDFNEIQAVRLKEKSLIWQYAIYLLCFIAFLMLCITFIKNLVFLTFIFAISLLFFILFSIVFWKIKYGILEKYRVFLDSLEMGKRSEYVCIFKNKLENLNENEDFDNYVFAFSSKQMNFLIHRQHSVNFIEGKKYYLECVGSYICQWEIVE